ncbi:MAG: formate dehydrogenase accessory sulfurtransferase FdhD [Candidatus Hydrothermarchaeaceae archaeon]
MLKKVRLKRISLGKGVEEREEYVIQDRVYHVRVDGEPEFRLTIIPDEVVACGVGRLLGEGIIKSVDDIERYKLNGSVLEFDLKREPKRKMKKMVEARDIKIPESLIFDCMRQMVKKSKMWRLTGGVHAAGLFDDKGEMLYFVEDIGKVNAVDKLIGRSALDGVDLSESILISTGRIVGSIVAKTVRAGIPIVVSKSAPLHSSIEVAEKEGVTLVCFVKGRRMNIYTHPKRIIGLESNSTV